MRLRREKSLRMESRIYAAHPLERFLPTIVLPLLNTAQIEIGVTNMKADPGIAPPKRGEKFRCDKCGMEIEVTADCNCKENEHVHFHCCGQELTKVK